MLISAIKSEKSWALSHNEDVNIWQGYLPKYKNKKRLFFLA